VLLGAELGLLLGELLRLIWEMPWMHWEMRWEMHWDRRRDHTGNSELVQLGPTLGLHSAVDKDGTRLRCSQCRAWTTAGELLGLCWEMHWNGRSDALGHARSGTRRGAALGAVLAAMGPALGDAGPGSVGSWVRH
jgi:hypothetical protein